MYKCSRKVRNAPNGAIGSPSPSPRSSLGLLNLLNAMNTELEREEAEVPHEVVTSAERLALALALAVVFWTY